MADQLEEIADKQKAQGPVKTTASMQLAIVYIKDRFEVGDIFSIPEQLFEVGNCGPLVIQPADIVGTQFAECLTPLPAPPLHHDEPCVTFTIVDPRPELRVDVFKDQKT